MFRLVSVFCFVFLTVKAMGQYRPSAEVKRLKFTVEKSLDRDARTFTQGFLFHDGKFIEGTGGYGVSQLRVSLPNEKVPLQQKPLPQQFFGEGVALRGDQLYQLTWKAERGIVYDLKTLKPLAVFRYKGEGWGLTSDANHFIMSNGSEVLSFRDPKSFKEVRKIRVNDQGKKVTNLNELEYIDGQIYANLWHSDWIVRIDPQTGQVTGVIDASKLLQPRPGNSEAVLNGIAYDSEAKMIYLTGKLWPKVFGIKLAE